MSLYSVAPLISAAFTLLLGLLIFWKSPKNSINRIFFYFTLGVTMWLGGTAVLIISCADGDKAIFWDRLVYFGVVFIPPTCLHFSSLFVKKIKQQRFFIFSSYICAFFFAIISQTKYFVDDLIYYPWGCHTQARLFHHIFLFEFALFIFFVFVNLINGLKNSTGIEKIQIRYILVAFTVLGLGVFGFLPAYGINIYPITYLCGLFAVVIMAYAIARHQLLNIKVIATEIFAVLIPLFLLVNFLFVKELTEVMFTGGLFLAVSFFSIFLVRSVLKEVRSKERLEKMATELRLANLNLQKLDKAKSDFISIASHQLRTPLSIVKGLASMVVEGSFGEVGDKVKEQVGKIYDSNERLNKLVDSLLDLSHIESGKLQFNFAKLDFAAMAQSVADELSLNAQKKGLQFSFQKPTEAMFVRADEQKLRQVVLNLVDNAIKYTPQGSVTMDLTKKDGFLQLAIKDTGVGLSEEEKNQLFQKFARGANAPRLHTEGAGIGLYVAKKMLEEHKGEIWTESEGEGKGSTFFVKLPEWKGEKRLSH